MYRTKLCLGTDSRYELDLKEQITLFQKTGFEGFFVEWNDRMSVREIKEHADSLGMIFQSIHAPFGKSAQMWEIREAAKAALEELLNCLHDCAAYGIPLMVCHAFIGFDDHTPNEIGVENYRVLVEEAKKLGVRIAFENTEGEEYLEVLMHAFSEYEHVGFCWDSGHEMCYNQSRDMLRLYGDRLFGTHLNDNLGIKDYGGKITYLDDLHLLPFDGIADWENIAKKLHQYSFTDLLTFELGKFNKPDRHENDVYEKMAIEEYVSEAYKRACRVAVLVQREEMR